MTDPPDELFALPADDPLPEHQPVPPAHPDRRRAIAAAYATVADRLGPFHRSVLERLRDGPPDRVVVVGETGFHDDVPSVLHDLGVPHRVVALGDVGTGEGRTGSTRPLDDLAGARVIVVQCVGPSVPPGADGLAVLADRVAEGAVLVSTCRALDVVALAFHGPGGAPLAAGPVAATEVAVPPRVPSAREELVHAGGNDVRWQVEGGSPAVERDHGRVDVLASAGATVPGWPGGAGPLWVRLRHGDGVVHHFAGHLRMTWCGETAGDPWGTGDAGDAATPAERASVRALVGALLRALDPGGSGSDRPGPARSPDGQGP